MSKNSYINDFGGESVKERENIQIESSQKVVSRDIKAFASISRIETLRDDEGLNATVGQARPDNKVRTAHLSAPLNGEGTSSPLRERMPAGPVRVDKHTVRHAEESLLSISALESGGGPEQKHLRMTVLGNTVSAFTLIELLVVVLIIGILASIVLPWYRTAVRKSKYVKLMPLVQSLKDAEEEYWYIHRKYATTFAELGFEVKGFTGTGTVMKNTNYSLNLDSVPSTSGVAIFGQLYEGGKNRMHYLVYLDHASVNSRGLRRCTALYKKAYGPVCVAVTGLSEPGYYGDRKPSTCRKSNFYDYYFRKGANGQPHSC